MVAHGAAPIRQRLEIRTHAVSVFVVDGIRLHAHRPGRLAFEIRFACNQCVRPRGVVGTAFDVTLFMMICGEGYFRPLLFGPPHVTDPSHRKPRPSGNRSIIIVYARAHAHIYVCTRISHLAVTRMYTCSGSGVHPRARYDP